MLLINTFYYLNPFFGLFDLLFWSIFVVLLVFTPNRATSTLTHATTTLTLSICMKFLGEAHNYDRLANPM